MLRNFRVISKISLRNLIRQKRRNIFLGVCIAIGMSILVVLTSFTSGLTDLIFNRLMIYMTGHIRVEAYESTSLTTTVMRDTPRMAELIRRNVSGVKRIDETIMAFGRAVGNGKTGLLGLVGTTQTVGEQSGDNFVIAEGSFEAIFQDDLYPGIVLFSGTAAELNLKLNDLVRVKFDTIYNQPQSPAFKLVGLIKSQNMFMDMVGMVDIKKLKPLLNMKPQESQGLNVIVDYPEDRMRIVMAADKLFAALKPAAAGVRATLSASGGSLPADVFALKVKYDTAARSLAEAQLSFSQGSGFVPERENEKDKNKERNKIIVSESAARALGLRVGGRVVFSYAVKYPGDPMTRELTVNGIFKDLEGFAAETAFVPDMLFHDSNSFFWNLPKEAAAAPADSALRPALLEEWDLLPRTADTESTRKKGQDVMREKWSGAKVDVSTMYETASMMIEMENTLNLIAVIAVGIIFSVVIIGVINTMRMTIRERTREIGTNRAIGMQRGTVRSVFVFEILYLTVFSCLVGIVFGLAQLLLYGLITFDMADNPFSMLMVNGHLYFTPSIGWIVGCFIVIGACNFLVAFLTARRAANMNAADALRHYE